MTYKAVEITANLTYRNFWHDWDRAYKSNGITCHVTEINSRSEKLTLAKVKSFRLVLCLTTNRIVLCHPYNIISLTRPFKSKSYQDDDKDGIVGN